MRLPIVFLHWGNHQSTSYEWTECFLKYAFKIVQIHGISRCRTEYQKPYLLSSTFFSSPSSTFRFLFLSCIWKPRQSPATNSYKFWFNLVLSVFSDSLAQTKSIINVKRNSQQKHLIKITITPPNRQSL